MENEQQDDKRPRVKTLRTALTHISHHGVPLLRQKQCFPGSFQSTASDEAVAHYFGTSLVGEKRWLTILAICLSLVLLGTDRLAAQSYRWGGTELNVRRSVLIPKTGMRSILVTEFLHQGQIDSDGRNVLVVAGNGKLAPIRILQLGPGDFCRLAIQTLAGQDQYTVFYGGKAPDPKLIPVWTNQDGLILETRRFRNCNFHSLESVRAAFDSSTRCGSDYVPTVFHGSNPFLLDWKPFLSRYSGYIHVPKAGPYGFLTSSRDCSFLLIDDKLVVSSPGRHGPLRRVVPNLAKGVVLSAGRHKFEYYHATSSHASTMMAAWIVPTKADHAKLTPIPPDAFRSRSIDHVQVGAAVMRSKKVVPDFHYRITGEVPLPNNDTPMVCVNFRYLMSPALRRKTSVHWDFGDGQTGRYARMDHVYLRSGVYKVKLIVKRDGKTCETTNRINIDRPRLTVRDRQHSLDDYLQKICTYDVCKLNASALRQFLQAYLWKSQLVLIPPQNTGQPSDQEDPFNNIQDPEGLAARKAVSQRYVNAVVTAGKTAFLNSLTLGTDHELFAIAKTIGSLARRDMNNSALAFQIWKKAAEKISDRKLTGICNVNAADIGVNDLLDAQSAKPLLQSATAELSNIKKGPEVSRLHRIWGDYYATIGNAADARNEYNLAQDTLDSKRPYVQQVVKQGVYSRSTEYALRLGDLDQAIKELRQWQQEFPAQNINGHLPLFFAKYLSATHKYRRVIALADRMLVVNPNSTYNDRLLFLSADSEMRLGHPDRALDSLRKLVKSYPGSRLVPLAQKNIGIIEATNRKPE